MTTLDLSINVLINLFISKEGNSYQVCELQSTLVNYIIPLVLIWMSEDMFADLRPSIRERQE